MRCDGGGTSADLGRGFTFPRYALPGAAKPRDEDPEEKDKYEQEHDSDHIPGRAFDSLHETLETLGKKTG